MFIKNQTLLPLTQFWRYVLVFKNTLTTILDYDNQLSDFHLLQVVIFTYFSMYNFPYYKELAYYPYFMKVCQYHFIPYRKHRKHMLERKPIG